MSDPSLNEVCKNCETPLQGEFCHACGQSSKIIRRPVRDLLSDVFGQLLQWDNRIFRTLKLLYLKPGLLSLEWSLGKRMRYVPPFRLYLISSLLLFLAFGLSESTGRSEFAKTYSEAQAGEAVSEDLKTAIKEARQEGQWFLAGFLEGVSKALEDPDAYFQRIKTNLPKAAFLLLPVFGLLHGLVEITRKRYLVDYIVFSLHFHAFAFSLIAVTLFIGLISIRMGDVAEYLSLSIPVYVCIGVRRLNPQSWGKSILKTLGILSAYMIILIFLTGLYFLLFLFV